jgi:CDP-diacylglycerol--glycerol-3-phosphate 3-phosphatidyltransferase
MTLAYEHAVTITPIRTVPNVVTSVRTAAAVVLGIAALVYRSPELLATAYATYWIGDILDGWSARRLHQETRIGAVLDIISDRACTSILAGCFLVLRPDVAAPMGVFLLQFMVLDCLLSLAFLGWPIKSPNYFYRVDRLVYRLNWSMPAKAFNSSVVILTMLAGWVTLALVIGVALYVVKAWSAHRVLSLRDWS